LDRFGVHDESAICASAGRQYLFNVRVVDPTDDGPVDEPADEIDGLLTEAI
jgi:hypothetical protein